MATASYDDAMGAALERLKGVGYEFGPNFVNHAPMAAEALALLGYTDEVPSWVDVNVRKRRYYDPPERRWALSADDAEDWRPALGDFSRVADWTQLFDRELAARPWMDVLLTWWPRLLPGMSGALTHGVIRTAHAVRAVAMTQGDGLLQRGELAQALGYWAARFWSPEPDGPPAAAQVEAAPGAPDAADSPDAPDAPGLLDPLVALDALVLDGAGVYARTPQSGPVGLVHAVTGPAAVRLVCDHLPSELHRTAYETAARSSALMRGWFHIDVDGGAPQPDPDPDADAGRQVIAQAVTLGDEHAIKLAEVAVRHYRRTPDRRLLTASSTATRLIGGGRL